MRNLKKSSNGLVIIAKGFLTLPNFHMLLKEDSITSQELGCWDLWQIANNVLNKGKFAIDLLFSGPEVLSSVSDKKTTILLPLFMDGFTASRLDPLRGGSLLFATKFPEMLSTHFTDLGRMEG